MITMTVTKIDPGKVERLRSWLAEGRRRSDEFRATLVDEGVRHEKVVLVDTADGPLVIYLMECDDYDAAAEVFAKSTHPIDAEHKRVMSEVRGESVPTEVLFDLQA